MDLEFVQVERYRFGVVAKDNPGSNTDRQSTDGEVIVSNNPCQFYPNSLEERNKIFTCIADVYFYIKEHIYQTFISKLYI